MLFRRGSKAAQGTTIDRAVTALGPAPTDDAIKQVLRQLDCAGLELEARTRLAERLRRQVHMTRTTFRYYLHNAQRQ